VSRVLARVRNRFAEWFEVEDFARIRRELVELREPAMYGDEVMMISSSALFRMEQADKVKVAEASDLAPGSSNTWHVVMRPEKAGTFTVVLNIFMNSVKEIFRFPGKPETFDRFTITPPRLKASSARLRIPDPSGEHILLKMRRTTEAGLIAPSSGKLEISFVYRVKILTHVLFICRQCLRAESQRVVNRKE